MFTDYYQLAANARQGNRGLLMAALSGLAIEKVLISYSGGGDSGDISEVVTTPEAALPQLRTEQLTASYPTVERKADGTGNTYKLEQRQVSLYEALADFAMGWVDAEQGGWENNDGGSGTVTIAVAEDTFTLEHTQYYTESSSHEYSC